MEGFSPLFFDCLNKFGGVYILKNKIGMFTILMLGLTIGIMASSISVAFAAKQVTIIPQEAKLVINGQNSAERPLVINGTSYLPVRVVADVLGLDVDWDQKTSTITITDKIDDVVEP